MGEYNDNRAQDGAADNGQQTQGSGAIGQSGVGYGDQGGQGATGQSGTGSMGQQGQTDTGMPGNDRDQSDSAQSGDDTGGLTTGEDGRSGQGGMQQDAIGSAEGSELDDEDSDTLEDQDVASDS